MQLVEGSDVQQVHLNKVLILAVNCSVVRCGDIAVAVNCSGVWWNTIQHILVQILSVQFSKVNMQSGEIKLSEALWAIKDNKFTGEWKPFV